MKPIKQLDYALINKIAAGEVVERPVSVVKELAENAVDAGASVVTVEIQDGGLTLIRVTDNGCGIPADQVSLAFAQHATSKIDDAEDLNAILTLGFRGEALSSIAAVAQVEIVTKTVSAVTGTRCAVHGGIETVRQPVGCADGTTVIVANLFYNTPARRKFLKKATTEAGYISDLIQKLALGHPDVAFRLINNGQSVLQTNGNGDRKIAIYNIYGKEIAQKLMPVRAVDGDLVIEGYAGKPEIARGNRNFELFFINGRYIKSELLQAAAEDAYHTALMHGRFPVLVLSIAIKPDAVDVNVHPTKLEVRFSDEDRVYRVLYEALREVLKDHSLIPDIRLNAAKKDRPNEPESVPLTLNETVMKFVTAPPLRPRRSVPPVHPNTLDPPLSPSTLDPPLSRSTPDPPLPRSTSDPPLPRSTSDPSDPPIKRPENAVLPTDTAISEEPPIPQRHALFIDYKIIGQVFQTYWLVTQGDSLLLIDQHAAHERVLYESLLARAESGPVASQPLLQPWVVRLTPGEAQMLREHQAVFTRLGFEIGAIDENQAAIQAVPLQLKGPADAAFFTRVLDSLALSDKTGAAEESVMKAVAMAACKAAVKANDKLSHAETENLIGILLSMENPFTCPHGRPTIVAISRRELEKMFKRIG